MNSTEIFIAFLACIPSAIVGLAIWLLQRKISKSEKAREEREKVREKNELYIIETVGASLALGEATARAVQRIPDAHCNGDMHTITKVSCMSRQSIIFIERCLL